MGTGLEETISRAQTLMSLEKDYNGYDVIGASIYCESSNGIISLIYNTPSGKQIKVNGRADNMRASETDLAGKIIDYFLALKKIEEKLPHPEFYPQLMDFRELLKIVKRFKPARQPSR